MHDLPPPTPGAIENQTNDFLRIFGDGEHSGDLQIAYSKAITGKLRNSRIRGVCWRVFFGLVDPKDMQSSVQSHRDRYQRLKESHIIDPRKHAEEMDLEVCNPLSQSDNNPWAQFFAQEDLEAMVKKDLQRLFPEHELFSKPEVRQMLLNILMVYSLEHPDLSYRQGMHELLGGVYFVLASDSQCTAASETAPTLLRSLTATESLEADCFLVFEQIMHALGEYFNTNGPDTESPILRRCATLQDELLQKQDPCLANHLRDHGIEPQFYAIKWFRLLFGRDFHLEDVLVLWDAMFAEAELDKYNKTVQSLPLLEHIAVVMLIYIRLDLLSKDNSGCLRRLMHYPPVEDITPFVERSRKSLRDEVLDLPSPAEPCGDTTLTETQLPKRRGPSLQMPRPKLGINREAEPSVEQVQIQTMKGTMERMSDRVETIANTLQHYAMFGGTGQDDLFLAIAELKQIKDILKGDIDA